MLKRFYNKRILPVDGLTLKDFMNTIPTTTPKTLEGNKKIYIETYGCQMNVSDSEIITSILKNSGYSFIHVDKEADIILINTCAIRENAEQKIWNRLNDIRGFSKLKKNKPILGILGCMAER
jgi:tRNA-2-methylthio-N6-dimethylallyladenosine synthase